MNMRCPKLKELPPPPEGKTGWPWTEESPQLPDAMPDGSPWPRISIVTPSYNQGQFIEETIRSVLLQGYPDTEYIIIDGGSTDDAAEIIKKYERWLKYWVSESDKGQGDAINKGFKKSSGQIITFQNSDDIYLKGTFCDVGARWRRLQNYGAIAGSFYFMDDMSRLNDVLYPPKLPHEGPTDLTLGPAGIYRLHQVSTFYTQKALDNVGRWVNEGMRYVFDRDLLYRICRNHRIILTDCAYGAFRQHNKNKSSAEILPFSQEFAKLYLLYLSGDKKQDRQRRRMARYHRANGYLNYAKSHSSIFLSIAALFIALFYRPLLLMNTGYLAIWLRKLKIKG